MDCPGRGGIGNPLGSNGAPAMGIPRAQSVFAGAAPRAHCEEGSAAWCGYRYLRITRESKSARDRKISRIHEGITPTFLQGERIRGR